MYSIHHSRTQSLRLVACVEYGAFAHAITRREDVLQSAKPISLAWQRGISALVFLAVIGSAQAYTRIGGIARTSATQVTSGSHHACALTTGGAVQCWGSDDYGQIGNGVTNPGYNVPQPAAIANGIVAISAGGFHTCALSTAGAVSCWGDNSNGQLGNGNGGTNSYSSTPVQVSGLNSGVIAIAAGAWHTCALSNSGSVWCWGGNSTGELGNGGTADSYTPSAVVGLPVSAIAIAAGESHTCALGANGGVWCWGYNNAYQLGNTGGNSAVPVAVAGLPAVAAITSGAQHNCAMTVAGGVQCWGWGGQGNLGNGSNQPSATPVSVVGLSAGVSAIGSGQFAEHTCAVQSGSLWCWGYNDEGQLGDGTTSDSNVPVKVWRLYNGATAVATSTHSTFLLTTAGGIQSWGLNDAGELGTGAVNFTTNSSIPVPVVGFIALDPASVYAGEYHSCVLSKSGNPFCWGLNGNGQLGIDSSTYNSTVPIIAAPYLIASLSGISLGGYHTCAVTTTSGEVYCWGYNGFGGLGNNTTTDSWYPVGPVGLSSGIISVSAGLYHSCALTTAGNVQCWGYNNDGQIGNGHNTDAWTPASVWNINSGAYGITAGGYQTCTMNSGWFPADCWGYNGYGQLGNSSTTNSNTPVLVTNLPGALSSISAGGYHTCAVSASGATLCWGYNGYGELGNGTFSNSSVPTSVTGLSSGTALVSAGAFHTCALTNNGAVRCWGNNGEGQLGNGSTSNNSTPVTVLNDAVAVAAGGWHSCAITGAASVLCWGYDAYGELGDGHAYSGNAPNYSASPVIAVYAGQAITFAPPASASHGANVTLNASATSGSPVSFDVWTPSTCSLSGNTLTLTGSGLCGVRASQSGWTFFGPYGFAAAPQQLRVIRIQ